MSSSVDNVDHPGDILGERVDPAGDSSEDRVVLLREELLRLLWDIHRLRVMRLRE